MLHSLVGKDEAGRRAAMTLSFLIMGAAVVAMALGMRDHLWHRRDFGRQERDALSRRLRSLGPR